MKKNIFAVVGFAAVLGLASSSFAEVTALKATFGGGCSASNTGKCTIKVTATGSDFGSDTVLLKYAADGKSFKYVSKNARALSETGRASFVFANKAGSYKVVSGPNGNDVRDHTSNTLTEK